MNELQSLEKEVQDSLVYQTIVVKDQGSYDKAATILKGVKGLQKQVEESYNPIIQKALASHREAIAQRDKYLNPLKTIESAIKSRISGYLAECEKKRLAEEERLRKEAEEKAAKERARLENKAEKALEKGNEEKANDLLEQAQQVEALVPSVAPIVQKAAGVSGRKIWKAKVVDFKSLSDDYKLINQSLLDSIARNTKGANKITGVEFYSEDVVSVR